MTHLPANPPAPPPAAQTMLPLLENLLCVALRARSGAGRLRVEAVRLEPSRITIELGLRNMTQLMDGGYGLELHILETGAAETRCRPNWIQPGGLAKLVGLGAKLLPRALLNEALQRLFGGWMHVEEEVVVLHHREMIAALLAGPGSRGGGEGSQEGGS